MTSPDWKKAQRRGVVLYVNRLISICRHCGGFMRGAVRPVCVGESVWDRYTCTRCGAVVDSLRMGEKPPSA